MRQLFLLALLVLFILPLALVPARDTAPIQAAAAAATFAPALTLVPSEDGTALYIDAGGVRPPGDTLFVNLGIGPGHNKGSWTMTFSDTLDLYVTTAAGFTPGVDTSSELHITTTLGLATEPVEFSRAFVRRDVPAQLTSPNGTLGLSLISAGTLPVDTYVAIVPSYAAPAAPPPEFQLVGETYSVRAPGSLPTADLPMSLRLAVAPQMLGRIDPHTLALAIYDTSGWQVLGGDLLTEQASRSVTATTRRFGTYALMSGPSWRDSFADLEGLDESASSGVILGLLDNELALVPETDTTGIGLSQLITAKPAVWGTLTYSATVPAGAQFAVDLLSTDGRVLLEDVASGTSLAQVDAQAHPSVRLRARLTAGPAGERPGLFSWGISWTGIERRELVYLPFIVR